MSCCIRHKCGWSIHKLFLVIKRDLWNPSKLFYPKVRIEHFACRGFVSYDATPQSCCSWLHLLVSIPSRIIIICLVFFPSILPSLIFLSESHLVASVFTGYCSQNSIVVHLPTSAEGPRTDPLSFALCSKSLMPSVFPYLPSLPSFPFLPFFRCTKHYISNYGYN